MAKQKTKFGWFTIPEWEKEEKWLRDQHKKFCNCCGSCYRDCFHAGKELN